MTLPPPPKASKRTILAIDPGNVESGWVIYQNGRILDKGITVNPDLILMLDTWIPSWHDKYPIDIMVLEMVQSYGDVVGQTVFETVFWIGRFYERWAGTADRMYRKKVKHWLGLPPSAGDTQVNHTVRQYFSPTGGGKDPYKGIKKQPGPLFGVHDDIWAALALAIAYEEKSRYECRRL